MTQRTKRGGSTMRFTKDQLIEALEERRDWAVKFDEKALAKHRKDEAQALREFKAACREAAKWDYPTAKKQRFNIVGHHYPPTCPRSVVADLDRTLNAARVSRQERYVIDENGGHARTYFLLTHDENLPVEVC